MVLIYYSLVLVRGNTRSGYPGSDDSGTFVLLYILRASFLEQLLDDGGKRWSGVQRGLGD
jgi:hypothetical protein